jgi:ABC-type Fe3+ transport system permease subunit/sugar lactone lactonase YvrE
MNWVLLTNSLLVSGSATALALSLGGLAALWAGGLGARSRNVVFALAIMALALPPFLVTSCWLHYLGQTGVWRKWLHLNIVSFGGCVWLLALLTWPITFFMVSSALRSLEPSQLESEPALAGWALLRDLLFPLTRRAFLHAAVLTFVLTLNNFAVPAILQVKVLPAEMWVQFNTTFSTRGALQASWPLIIGPLLVLLWFARQEVPWPRIEGPVSARLFRRQLGRPWFLGSSALTAGLGVLAVALPLFELVSVKRTWTELPGALAAGQLALWNSVWLAAVSATVCLVLGWLTWRWPVGLLLWFTFLMPGVLLGIGYIKVFNRSGLAWFYQSAGIVILAYVVRYLAIGWNTLAHALHTTDPELRDVARLDGANSWQMLRYVYWPQIAPQAAAAWYVVFLLCIWDVESIVLIQPPGGETLSLRVFNLLHYGYNTQVNALCLTLLVAGLAPLAVWAAWHGLRRLAPHDPRQPIPSIQIAQRLSSGSSSCSLLLLACGLILLCSSCSPGSRSNSSPLNSKLFARVQIIGTRGVGVGQLNKPRSVAVDAQDNLYVVDMTGRVQKFSPNGAYLLAWQMPQTDLGKPKGMCRDHDGNIVVVEPHYQRVNHYSPEGKLVAQWGERGTNSGQFMMPRAVAVNSRGELIVSEYLAVERVQRFSAREKRFLDSFGHMGTAPGEFNRPEGLCVDAQDRIYVADSCNHRIEIFSGDGKFIRTYGRAGSGKGELSYPYDICVDAAGRQYVCEFGNSRIQVFDANDQPIEIIGGPGSAPAQFGNPWGVALDSAGNLYVADSQNHRVQKLVRKAPLL